MRAGDPAGKVGDGGDQRRPDLGRRVGIGPVVAAGMETERSGFVQSRNAAFAQVRFCDGALNRLRHREQAARGFGRSDRRRWLLP